MENLGNLFFYETLIKLKTIDFKEGMNSETVNTLSNCITERTKQIVLFISNIENVCYSIKQNFVQIFDKLKTKIPKKLKRAVIYD